MFVCDGAVLKHQGDTRAPLISLFDLTKQFYKDFKFNFSYSVYDKIHNNVLCK